MLFNIILLKKESWSPMLKVNNNNIFDIQLVSGAANCKTILLFKDNKLLESNILMCLLRKGVKMKLI